MSSTDSVHINLDGAWPSDCLEAHIDCRSWGGHLRYSATTRGIERFHEFIRPHTAKFTLFGSGDFHHLTALWLRQMDEPVTLISFDNHPDWDIRPPRWCCGTWINRALELPNVRRAAIWGCGNFELNWPGHLFVSRKALNEQRLEVWPWTERLKPSGRKRFPGITHEDWRSKFTAFAQGMEGEPVYVTVDLDCLRRDEATTNWEDGLFTIADIQWALGELRSRARIAGGDLCGAYTKPKFARLKQRIESALDHPRSDAVDELAAAKRNARARETLWGALTGRTVEHLIAK